MRRWFAWLVVIYIATEIIAAAIFLPDLIDRLTYWLRPPRVMYVDLGPIPSPLPIDRVPCSIIVHPQWSNCVRHVPPRLQPKRQTRPR